MDGKGAEYAREGRLETGGEIWYIVNKEKGLREGYKMPFGVGFDFMFTAVFVLIVAGFVITIGNGISTWNKNNQSPRLTVTAMVVSKRTDVSHHSHANAGDITGAHGYTTTSFTSYYVTFQVESGDRMEFSVTSVEYGMLAEGDMGRLSFQGTRYLAFERS